MEIWFGLQISEEKQEKYTQFIFINVNVSFHICGMSELAFIVILEITKLRYPKKL